jgi:hypothetical protein
MRIFLKLLRAVEQTGVATRDEMKDCTYLGRGSASGGTRRKEEERGGNRREKEDQGTKINFFSNT